jgi:transposase
MSQRRYELTDFEWSIIAPLLPNKPRGVQAHPASLSRRLSKAGVSFKKSADGLGMQAR